mmetsp:Transcript_23755/g.67147  ORF Transcript_23755/g.67147 Transcript_23755/m.67147 type:complete len:222 (+) Transcript_23755:2407-3072(+)
MLVTETPHGPSRGSHQGRRNSLDKASLVTGRAAHSPQFRQGQNCITRSLFQRGDEQQRERSHDLRPSSRHVVTFVQSRCCVFLQRQIQHRNSGMHDSLVTLGHSLQTLDWVQRQTFQKHCGRHRRRHRPVETRHTAGRQLLFSLEVVLLVAEIGIAPYPARCPVGLDLFLFLSLRSPQMPGEEEDLALLALPGLLCQVLARGRAVSSGARVEERDFSSVER